MRTIFYTLASIVLAPAAFLITLIVAAAIYTFVHAEYDRFHHKNTGGEKQCTLLDDKDCV
jgi:hypothetical protein